MRPVLLALTLLVPLLSGCLEAGKAADDSEPPTGPVAEAVAKLVPEKLAWRSLTPQPTPRAEHMAAVLDGKIYSIGGYFIPNDVDGAHLGPAAFTATASVEVYDIATDTWSEGPDYPVEVNHAMAVAYDGFVYVFNGDESYKLDVSNDQWIPIADTPAAHNAGTAAVDPDTGLVYIAAGRGTHQLHVYDTATDTYQERAPMEIRRDHVASAFAGGKFYLMGGDVQGHAVNSPSIEEYDPETDTWRQRAPIEDVRGSVVGVGWRGHALLLGGQNQTYALGEPSYDNAEAYHPPSDSWVTLPDMPRGRHGFGAVVWEDKVYAVAGAPQQGVSGYGNLDVLEIVDSTT